MEEYIEKVQQFASYINTEEKIVGIYATTGDCFIAENSYALKRLKKLYKYRIQMVIK